ncbi:MAG: 4Fe-4S dicluster domain-containing protein [Candidatus Thorarchaeota archaeon]
MTIAVEESGLEISYDPERCSRCGMCLEVCPFNVWELPESGPAVISRPADCTNCTSCAKNCLGAAITVRNIGCGCIWNESARRSGITEESLVGPGDIQNCSSKDTTSCCG